MPDIKFLKTPQIEQIIWFLVFVSWLPVIASFSVLPSSQVTLQDQIAILIPQSTTLINLLLFAACLFLIYTLMKRDKLQKYFLLATLPFLTALLIPIFNQAVLLTPAQSISYSAYLFSVMVSVFLFLRYGHIFSPAFVIFCLILITDSIWLSVTDITDLYEIESGESVDAVLNNHYSTFGLIYAFYTIDLIKTLLFIFLIVLLKMLMMAYADNKAFVQSLNWSELKNYSSDTFKLWYPMFLIFAGISLIYTLLSDFVFVPKLIDHINEESTVIERTEADEKPRPKTVREAILNRNESGLRNVNAKTQGYVEKLLAETRDLSGKAPDSIYNEMNNALPKRLPGTKQKKCGYDIILCPIGNATKALTNRAYVSVKKRQLNKLRLELEVIANDSSKSAEQKTKEMQALINSSTKKMQQINRTAVNSSFNAYHYFSVLMLIYTLIILMKTFLIVFSRISFSPDTQNHATFNKENSLAQQGKIHRLHDKFTIPESDQNHYFFARHGITIAGVPPARKTPQKLTAIFTRIFHKRWSFNYVSPKKSSEGVTVTVAKPAEFVRWDLAEGEKVYFHFSDFIGMSDKIKIRRQLSLSVSTLLFGRIIYYYAEGSGSLFLKTKAQPAITPEKEALSGQNSALLLAWNRNVGFKIDASKTITDTFLSDYHVKPVNKNELIVLDLSEERGTSTSAGIFRFIKSFLLPV